jgi:lipopolysaccharide assembly outer membrane protein LptD (OstA)
LGLRAWLHRTTRAVLCLALLFSAVQSGNTQEAPEPAKANEADAQAEEPSLFETTLALDIQTADYYELIAWCRQLGLSERGGRTDLQNRLYEFYGIKAPQEPEAKSGTRIVVESARSTEYFTIDQIDESYLRLAGGIRLAIYGEAQASVHRIEADTILFNQTNDTISATGNVTYVLEKDGETETFSGPSLSFNMDSWDGTFVEGVTTRERTVEEEKLTFYFGGETITRSEGDVITLENGTITSSKPEDPYYFVRARKIWVLAPGEWGLRDAVLHVGRVPVLYIPFFFNPAEEIVFHPVFGTREREGSFMQTTTYLLGEKERSESPFSFLQIADAETQETKKELKGLFLRRTDVPKDKNQRAGWFVKLLFDLYTRLGVHFGVDVHIGKTASLQALDFLLAVARSRTIFEKETGYSAFYRNEFGMAQSDWHESRILTAEIPLRFGLKSSFKVSENPLSVQGTVESYSDPFFPQDFWSREEDFDWLGLLGMGDEAETPPGKVNSLLWRLQTRLTPKTGELSPWIQTASLNDFTLSLSWATKDTPAEALAPWETESPMRTFFYPKTLTVPSAKAQLRGTLLQWPGQSRARRNAADTRGERSEDGPTLRAPWDTPAQPESEDPPSGDGEEEAEEPVVRIPTVQRDEALATAKPPVSLTMSYDVRPSTSNVLETQWATWETVDDIEVRRAYAVFAADQTSNLQFRGSLYDSLLSLSNQISMLSQYRTHYDRSETVTDIQWERWQQSDWEYTSARVTDRFTAKTSPLASVPFLKPTNLTYNLAGTVYRWEYSHTEGDRPIYVHVSPEWTEEFVTKHSVAATLGIVPFGETQTLTLTRELPPGDQAYTGKLSLAGFGFKSSIGTGVTRPSEGEREGEWVYSPLSMSLSYSPGEAFSVSNSARYDLDEGYWQNTTANIRSGGFTAQLTAERQRPWEFHPELGWQRLEDPAFIPWSASVSYTDSLKIGPYWKNRVNFETLRVNSKLSTNLQRYTESVWSLDFTLRLKVYEFLDLSFTSSSQNDSMYRYIPGLSDQVGRAPRNLFVDLAKSFNFFDIEDRRESFFNVSSLKIEALHHLYDWDLSVSYSGSAKLSENDAGVKQYEWNPVLTFFVKWKPIPEIERTISHDESGLSLQQ